MGERARLAPTFEVCGSAPRQEDPGWFVPRIVLVVSKKKSPREYRGDFFIYTNLRALEVHELQAQPHCGTRLQGESFPDGLLDQQ